MESKLTKEITILPSVCDSDASLSIPDTFALFMDIAAEHAQAMGIGAGVLVARGLFWLTVRTRIRFYRRPGMMERVTASTWPEAPNPSHPLRGDRDYMLEQGDELLAAGKTEWGVLELKTGRLHPMSDVYPPDFAFDPSRVWPEPFTRIGQDGMEDFGSYTVRSTDIDLGKHMNNAAYARMLAGAFSCKEWRTMDVGEMEIAFRAPCYEGDTLLLQKKADGGTLSLRAALPDGKTVVLSRIVSK